MSAAPIPHFREAQIRGGLRQNIVRYYASASASSSTVIPVLCSGRAMHLGPVSSMRPAPSFFEPRVARYESDPESLRICQPHQAAVEADFWS